MNNESVQRWFMIVGLLLLPIAIGGCNVSREGYRNLTVKNELVHYSVEYPASYDRAGPRVDYQSGPLTSVTFLAPQKRIDIVVPSPVENEVKTVSAEYVPASIKILVWEPYGPPNTPNSSSEYVENILSRGARLEYFRLLERSPITVSGIPGEMIYFVDEWGLLAPKDEGVKLKFTRVVYFDCDGLIWRIDSEAEEEMLDEVNAYFDYVLQTFKILGSPNSGV